MAQRTFILSLLSIAHFLIFSINSFAQQKQGANWLFGGSIHLDFNDPKPTIETFSFTDTIAEAVATVSDRNGKLLFFSSNGHIATRQKINGVYQEMPNGTLIPGVGFRKTSAEMLVQSLADSNIYYLFFLAPSSSVNNSIGLFKVTIDLRLNNGYGDVVANSKQLLKKGLDDMKLSAALHSNNRDIWILTQNYPNDTVFAFLLNTNGILPPVKTKVNQPYGSYGRLKTSPNGELFAMLGAAGVQLFDFNRALGTASHKYNLPAPDPNYLQYCFAFSPDNSKLYTGTISYAILPNNTTVFQYDLAAGSTALVNASRNVIFNTSNYGGVGDMQLAMDGKIYITFGFPSTSLYLSQINCPDFYGTAAGFKFNGINLSRPINGGVLPALNQTLFQNAGKLQAQANQSIICQGDTVQLSAYGAGADKFKWEVANGLTIPSDTLNIPLVNPTVTTTYKVMGYSVCRSDTAFVKVTVIPKPKAVSISGPTQIFSLSENQEYFVQDPMPGSIFNWQVSGGTIASGQGQRSITVNWGNAGEGIVSVIEIPHTGCPSEKASFKVELTEGPAPIIYNIITPNNDNRNDAFVIENLKWYPENKLQIFNRWGVEVYKSSNYQNNWQAEKLSSGVYYYFFSANGKSWKGWFEVTR